MSASRRNDGHDGSNQRGIALVAMLLVLALCAALAARAAFANQLWLRQVSNQGAAIRVAEMLRGAEWWLALILERDERGFDGATDLWAHELPPIPAGNVTLRGEIDDLQGRFNVNNLVTEEGMIDRRALTQLGRLLQLLRLDPTLAEAIADWIDRDDAVTGGGGAESGFYAVATPPRLPANQPIASLAELRQVRGIDRAVLQVLAPYLAALPARTPLNVNTASAEVLAATLLEWGPAETILIDVGYWVEDARRNPARALDEFARRTQGGVDPLAADGLAVASRFFVARLGGTESEVESWLETEYQRDNSGPARIIARRRVLP